MKKLYSTKLTKSGQTTIPREIRDAMGLEIDAEVYWSFDGEKAYISLTPPNPLDVSSAEDFWSRMAESQKAIEQGQVFPADEFLSQLRQYDGAKAV